MKCSKIKSNTLLKIFFILASSLCLISFFILNPTFGRYATKIDLNPFDVNFSAGNIEFSLFDNEKSLILVPGTSIINNPKVIIKKNSEECYIFFKIVKSNNFDNYIEYQLTSDWTKLDGESDVYYKEINKTSVDIELNILENGQFIVKDTITMDDLNNLKEEVYLNFVVHAVQKTKDVATVYDAWAIVN